MPSKSSKSAGTEVVIPAWAALRRIRWAIAKARTQVKQVDPDLVVGEVTDRGERDHVGVFGLPEACFEVFLRPVGVDDLLDRPVVVVGDQDPLPEDLFFEGGLLSLIHI